MGGAEGLPVHGACSELTRVPHAWPGDWRAALREQVPGGSRLSARALQSRRRLVLRLHRRGRRGGSRECGARESTGALGPSGCSAVVPSTSWPSCCSA